MILGRPSTFASNVTATGGLTLIVDAIGMGRTLGFVIPCKFNGGGSCERFEGPESGLGPLESGAGRGPSGLGRAVNCGTDVDAAVFIVPAAEDAPETGTGPALL